MDTDQTLSDDITNDNLKILVFRIIEYDLVQSVANLNEFNALVGQCFINIWNIWI